MQESNSTHGDGSTALIDHAAAIDRRRRRTADVHGNLRSFTDLLLPSHLIVALSACGYLYPSPVQEAAIPVARTGSDIIVQAKSGTGKTVVFAAICLDRIKTPVATPQALILTPTREIAVQIQQVISAVAAHLPPPLINCSAFVGGLPVVDDEKKLRRTCHIVVGTPGRLGALLESGALKTASIHMVVIDEADSLLGDSFFTDTTWILDQLPHKKQVMAFSATYTPELLADLEPLMKKPQRIMVTSGTVELLGVRQCYVEVQAPEAAAISTKERESGGSTNRETSVEMFQAKVEALKQVMSRVSFHQAVVFCNHKARVEWLVKVLGSWGFPSTHLSAARTQEERQEAVSALKSFQFRAVVATDVMARGVDFEHVNLVLSLDMAPDSATHMHRTGRTGRFGTFGLSVSLVTPEELKTLQGFLAAAGAGAAQPLPDQVPPDWYTYELSLPDSKEAYENLLAAAPTSPPPSPTPPSKPKHVTNHHAHTDHLSDSATQGRTSSQPALQVQEDAQYDENSDPVYHNGDISANLAYNMREELNGYHAYEAGSLPGYNNGYDSSRLSNNAHVELTGYYGYDAGTMPGYGNGYDSSSFARYGDEGTNGHSQAPGHAWWTGPPASATTDYNTWAQSYEQAPDLTRYEGERMARWNGPPSQSLMPFNTWSQSFEHATETERNESESTERWNGPPGESMTPFNTWSQNFEHNAETERNERESSTSWTGPPSQSLTPYNIWSQSFEHAAKTEKNEREGKALQGEPDNPSAITSDSGSQNSEQSTQQEADNVQNKQSTHSTRDQTKHNTADGQPSHLDTDAVPGNTAGARSSRVQRGAVPGNAAAEGSCDLPDGHDPVRGPWRGPPSDQLMSFESWSQLYSSGPTNQYSSHADQGYLLESCDRHSSTAWHGQYNPQDRQYGPGEGQYKLHPKNTLLHGRNESNTCMPYTAQHSAPHHRAPAHPPKLGSSSSTGTACPNGWCRRCGMPHHSVASHINSHPPQQGSYSHYGWDDRGEGRENGWLPCDPSQQGVAHPWHDASMSVNGPSWDHGAWDYSAGYTSSDWLAYNGGYAMAPYHGAYHEQEAHMHRMDTHTTPSRPGHEGNEPRQTRRHGLVRDVDNGAKQPLSVKDSNQMSERANGAATAAAKAKGSGQASNLARAKKGAQIGANEPGTCANALTGNKTDQCDTAVRDGNSTLRSAGNAVTSSSDVDASNGGGNAQGATGQRTMNGPGSSDVVAAAQGRDIHGATHQDGDDVLADTSGSGTAGGGSSVQGKKAPGAMKPSSVGVPWRMITAEGLKQLLTRPADTDATKVVAPADVDVAHGAEPADLDDKKAVAPADVDLTTGVAHADVDMTKGLTSASTPVGVSWRSATAQRLQQLLTPPADVDVVQHALPASVDATTARAGVDADADTPNRVTAADVDATTTFAPASVDATTKLTPADADAAKELTPAGMDDAITTTVTPANVDATKQSGALSSCASNQPTACAALQGPTGLLLGSSSSNQPADLHTSGVVIPSWVRPGVEFSAEEVGLAAAIVSSITPEVLLSVPERAKAADPAGQCSELAGTEASSQDGVETNALVEQVRGAAGGGGEETTGDLESSRKSIDVDGREGAGGAVGDGVDAPFPSNRNVLLAQEGAGVGEAVGVVFVKGEESDEGGFFEEQAKSEEESSAHEVEVQELCVSDSDPCCDAEQAHDAEQACDGVIGPCDTVRSGHSQPAEGSGQHRQEGLGEVVQDANRVDADVSRAVGASESDLSGHEEENVYSEGGRGGRGAAHIAGPVSLWQVALRDFTDFSEPDVIDGVGGGEDDDNRLRKQKKGSAKEKSRRGSKKGSKAYKGAKYPSGGQEMENNAGDAEYAAWEDEYDWDDEGVSAHAAMLVDMLEVPGSFHVAVEAGEQDAAGTVVGSEDGERATDGVGRLQAGSEVNPAVWPGAGVGAPSAEEVGAYSQQPWYDSHSAAGPASGYHGYRGDIYSYPPPPPPPPPPVANVGGSTIPCQHPRHHPHDPHHHPHHSYHPQQHHHPRQMPYYQHHMHHHPYHPQQHHHPHQMPYYQHHIHHHPPHHPHSNPQYHPHGHPHHHSHSQHFFHQQHSNRAPPYHTHDSAYPHYPPHFQPYPAGSHYTSSWHPTPLHHHMHPATHPQTSTASALHPHSTPHHHPQFAAPRQEPAAPRQEPAAPRQEPAAPRQEPAAPRQEPAAPRQEPAAGLSAEAEAVAAGRSSSVAEQIEEGQENNGATLPDNIERQDGRDGHGAAFITSQDGRDSGEPDGGRNAEEVMNLEQMWAAWLEQYKHWKASYKHWWYQTFMGCAPPQHELDQ